ncbi:MAG: thiamine diphosphokinase [Clostridia bacterium]|nr:thiamine diphosphokinase [Clostridia bacterium]
MGICYVVGAGDCAELNIKKKDGDLIIAADAGYKYLIKAGINPDVIIGDFDSLGVVPQENNVIRLNPVKDITDMSAAVNIGIEKGYTEFHIYGACGGRIDHTLANIQLVASLSQSGYKAFIHDGKTVITALCNDSIEFDSSYKGIVSVFSHSDECCGVCIRGLKYTLDNAVLKNAFPLGVSNEFMGVNSEIVIGQGTAIIVYSKDKP